MASVLLVDDDVELVDMLGQYLRRDGFDVAVVHDGARGLEEALSGRHTIAVIDVMMPGMDGIETLRCIRRQSQLPVLMLTAKGDDVDRIVGLELGADDYVAKPCTPRELAARLRAILRRTQIQKQEPQPQASISIGAMTLWSDQRRAECNGQPLALTSTEFSLLDVLARNVGKTVSKNALSEQGLGRALARFDRNIDVHLSSIRQKLGSLADGRSMIQTVYRQGYMLIRE